MTAAMKLKDTCSLKAILNIDSTLKIKDITFLTKVCLVKAMVFLVVMHGYESWTVRKAECRRIDAFELSLSLYSLSHVWLFATPCPRPYQVPPSMGFSRQEYWSGLPFPSPEDLPNRGIKPGSPTLQADTLPSEPPGNILRVKSKRFWANHFFILPTLTCPASYHNPLCFCVTW